MVGNRQILAVWAVVAVVGGMTLIQALLPGPGVAKSPTVQDLEVRVAALEAKLACVTATSSATEVVFEGCNIHIRNGLGSTESTNLSGNLIIGYNEPDPLDPPGANRSGSHNLVIGPEHTYSSHGGLVAGFANRITGPHASVSGGANNEASGVAASVSGGNNHKASGTSASVSGGHDNEASGNFAHVSGGANNKATNWRASVGGGHDNKASGDSASVSGGANNEASGARAGVGGGNGCTLPGDDQWGAISVGGGGGLAIGDC